MIAVRLPPELEADLKKLAKETGRTQSYFIVDALTNYLENMRDRFEAEKALKDFYSGDKKTWSLEEVKAELEL